MLQESEDDERKRRKVAEEREAQEASEMEAAAQASLKECEKKGIDPLDIHGYPDGKDSTYADNPDPRIA